MWSEDEWPGSVSGRPWREGFFDFGSGLTQKVSGFGFGYCAYCGVKAKPLIILCISISCKETQLMLRKNWNIITTYSSLQPTAMPPIQKNSVVPKKQASKIWRHSWWRYCKVSSVPNPTKGHVHKSSLECWKHHESQFPLLANLVKVVLRRWRTLWWWSTTWGCLTMGLSK